MMRSLRNRIVAATLAATLLILLCAAALTYGMIRAALFAEFDETLLAKAKAIAALVEMDEGRFEIDLGAAQMPEFEPGERCEYFQIWGVDGASLFQSSSLVGNTLNKGSGSEVPGFRFTTLPDGRPGRRVTLLSAIRTDHGAEANSEAQLPAIVSIAAARDTPGLNRTLGRLALLLGSVTLGAALLTVAVLILVVRFALKPVGALAAQIAEVAHELRTPLAGLSTALEVCSSRPRDESTYREVVLKCLGTTRAMQRMVEIRAGKSSQITAKAKAPTVRPFAAKMLFAAIRVRLNVRYLNYVVASCRC